MKPYATFDDVSSLLPDVPEDSILSRAFYTSDRLKANLFRFAPGQELSEHTSTHAAVLHFLEGEADLTLGGDSFEVKGGAWVYMQPRLAHSILARTPVTMLLYLLTE